MPSTLLQAVVSALSEGACPVLEELELRGWDREKEYDDGNHHWEDEDREKHTLQAKVQGATPEPLTNASFS